MEVLHRGNKNCYSAIDVHVFLHHNVTAGVCSVRLASNTGEISTRLLEHSDLLFSNSLHQFAMSLVHQPRQSAQPEQSALPRQSAQFSSRPSDQL